MTQKCVKKLLDSMMEKYAQRHTERAPTTKNVNSIEEVGSLNDKNNMLMSTLSLKMLLEVPTLQNVCYFVTNSW